MKKILLGIASVTAIAAPIVAVISCGEKNIKRVNGKDNVSDKTWTGGNKPEPKEIPKQDVVPVLPNVPTDEHVSIESLQKSLSQRLVPHSVNTWQNKLDDLKNGRDGGNVDGFIRRAEPTDLEKSIIAARQADSAMAMDGTKTIWQMFGDGGGFVKANSNVSIFEPITNSNSRGARYHTVKLLPFDFSKKSPDDQYRDLLIMIFGGQDKMLPKSEVAGASAVLFEVRKSGSAYRLHVWVKADSVFPKASSLFKFAWSDTNEDVIALRRALPNLQPNDDITPEKYSEIIKYFYHPVSAEQADRFEKDLEYRGDLRWARGSKTLIDTEVNPHNLKHAKKLTSPLTWSFDGGTINAFSLGGKQTVGADGRRHGFWDDEMYGHNTNGYVASELVDEFDMYNGKMTSRSWIFEHMFENVIEEDGNGGNEGQRYHSGYNRNINSIDFLANYYQTCVTTHVSPTNPNDQIIDYLVKYVPTDEIVYRSSVVMPHMQPDVRKLFDGANFTVPGATDIISEAQSKHEVTLKEFMDSIVQAQDALKAFKSLAASYLLDPLIGEVIDTLSSIELSKISEQVAQQIYDKLKARTDINIPWFFATLGKGKSYIQKIVVSRGDNHYSLGVEQFAFDNIINVILDIARVIDPESFTGGDLSHI